MQHVNRRTSKSLKQVMDGMVFDCLLDAVRGKQPPASRIRGRCFFFLGHVSDLLVHQSQKTPFCVALTFRHASLDLWGLYADETNPLLRERFFARVTEMYGYPVLLAICIVYVPGSDTSTKIIQNQSSFLTVHVIIRRCLARKKLKANTCGQY